MLPHQLHHATNREPEPLLDHLDLVSNSLVTTDGELYALVRGDGSITSLVRLNPATGLVAAQTTLTGDDEHLVVTGNVLWVTQTPVSGPIVLRSFHLGSLKPRNAIRLTVDNYPQYGSSVAADAAGKRRYVGSGREVVVIDARTSDVIRQITLPGTLRALSVAPDGARLYAAVEVKSLVEQDALLVLDPATGVTVRTDRTFGPVRVADGLLTTAGGLWMTVGFGHGKALAFLREADSGQRRSEASTDGNVIAAVTVSDHRAWLGGPDFLACADPDSGVDRAKTAIPHSGGPLEWLDSIVTVGNGTVAAYHSDTTNGLARLTPPVACAAGTTSGQATSAHVVSRGLPDRRG